MKSSPEDPGRAIELRLQEYRYRVYVDRPLVSGSEKDAPVDAREQVKALCWLEELAASGHWGAQRLLKRVAWETKMAARLVRVDPEAAMRLARLSPHSAYEAASAEAHQPEPDWARVRDWLALARMSFLADAIDEARAICGELAEADLRCIRTAISQQSRGGEVLVDMAAWREASDDSAKIVQAYELNEAGARLGERRALRSLLKREWAATSDRAALAEQWCARYAAHVPAAEIGAALRIAGPLSRDELEMVRTVLDAGVGERGALLLEIARTRHAGGANPDLVAALLDAATEVGGKPEFHALWTRVWQGARDKRSTIDWWFARFPDFALNSNQTFQVGVWIEKSARDPDEGARLAASWYARAKDAPLPEGTPIPRSLCYYVAAQLNGHMTFHRAKESDLAVRWLERGIVLGDDKCLDDWLHCCAKGLLGIKPDPEAAAERVRRVAAVWGEGRDDFLGGYSDGVSAIVARAEALIDGKEGPRDIDLARRWLKVCAMPGVRYGPGLQLLAKL